MKTIDLDGRREWSLNLFEGKEQEHLLEIVEENQWQIRRCFTKGFQRVKEIFSIAMQKSQLIRMKKICSG